MLCERLAFCILDTLYVKQHVVPLQFAHMGFLYSLLIWLLILKGKLEGNFFVYNCGTHYSNCNLVILHNKIDSILS